MNDAKVSEMSVEQKEYHYRRTASSLEHEVERLRDINKDLLEALRLYRASHNTCIDGEPQGLCNKCRIAEAAIRKAEGK